MNYRKKPNHLAKTIDHQESAASTLPNSLTIQLLKRQQLTDEIKKLLTNCLPQDILETLWVVKFENEELVLSVQSQTAANHLRYQKNNLNQILVEQSITFHQLKHINVITNGVTPSLKSQNHETKNFNNYMQTDVAKNNVQSQYQKGLTEITKKTISYVIEHVILDEQLKTSLSKLLK